LLARVNNPSITLSLPVDTLHGFALPGRTIGDGTLVATSAGSRDAAEKGGALDARVTA